MYRTLTYTETRGKFQFVDVRSPKEYEEYTIPGAINIPLFSNEERHIIGTTYKQCSVEEAVSIGVEFASKNLPEIHKRLIEAKKNSSDIILFCERGGMRSSSLYSLLNSVGMKVSKLDGGYKGYRKFVNENLPLLMEDVDLIVLHGMTGTGKTQILKELENKGRKVLDLEGFANHRGSLLGSVGLGKQNCQRTFESLLLEKLMDMGPGTYFTEAESSRIGNVIQPKYLLEKLRTGRAVLIESSMEGRVRRLVEEYTSSENYSEEILSAVDKMEKYTGAKKAIEFRSLVNKKEFDQLAEIMMLSYYDPMYGHGQNKHDFEYTFSSDDMEVCIENLENII